MTALALALWATPWWSALAADGGTAIAVVVNRANPVDNLTLTQLRDLLTGKTATWPTGKRVVIVLTDEGDSRTAVLKICCRQAPQDYDTAMLRAVFTGDLPAAPRHLNTGEAVSKFVFNVAGGIGIVPLEHMTDIVKTVRIAGLTPADAAYPLRTR